MLAIEELTTRSNTDPPLAGPSSSSAPDGTASEVDPGVDPYAAPPETVYPEGAVPNPCINSRNEPPHCLNLPKGALYRPAFFPADFDDRINLESIWMGLQKNTGEHLSSYISTDHHASFQRTSWARCMTSHNLRPEEKDNSGEGGENTCARTRCHPLQADNQTKPSTFSPTPAPAAPATHDSATAALLHAHHAWVDQRAASPAICGRHCGQNRNPGYRKRPITRPCQRQFIIRFLRLCRGPYRG